jgi:hypothetical protein
MSKAPPVGLPRLDFKRVRYLIKSGRTVTATNGETSLQQYVEVFAEVRNYLAWIWMVLASLDLLENA